MAKRDVPVFPVDPRTKAPLTKNGVKDASTDQKQLGRWWSQHGEDAGLAAATGKRSGFDALDIDPKNGGDRSILAMEHRYGHAPETTVQTTPSGGEHRLFKFRESNELINRHGGNAAPGSRVDFQDTTRPAPGLDCRTSGGYILVPPSPGYEWKQTAGSKDNLPDWPDWLKERFKKRENQQHNLDFDLSKLSPEEREQASRQAKAILRYASRDIATARVGQQETTLNDSGLRIARVASSGLITRDEAMNAIIQAGQQMQSDPSARPWTDRDIRAKAERVYAHGFPMGPPDDLNWHSGDRRRGKRRQGGGR